MRSRITAALIALVLFYAPLDPRHAIVTAPVRAAPKEDPLATRVNDAIKLGTQYLRDQGSTGSWDADPAITTLARAEGLEAHAGSVEVRLVGQVTDLPKRAKLAQSSCPA